MRPLIGITPAYDLLNQRLYLRPRYLEAVAESGGRPLILPLMGAELGPEELIGGLHGLLLTGGSDVDPAFFQEEPHPQLGEVQPLRDSLELGLVPLALREGIPLLGICRGIQVMNVAMGGSLYQDLPSQRSGRFTHDQEEPRDRTTHTVTLGAGSQLARIANSAQPGVPDPSRVIRVNSLHHQAVKVLAETFVASAWADDGVIEGIESPHHPFAVGVQWHPEDLYESEHTSRALFLALVAAARRRMDAGTDRF